MTQPHTPSPTESSALAPKPTTTPDVIRTPAEFTEALKTWGSNYHVLSPFTNITGLAAQHGIIASVVKINSDPSPGGAGEVYGGLPFLKGEKGAASEEVAIAKLGLRKIAECAAISTTTLRTDDRAQHFYWEVKCVATYRGIDGSVVTREATSEWDLRDGSPRLKGWKPDQISEGRKNGLRNCETRAINAAIREFGIKQKYTRRELEKPFVVLRVAFQPDMSNPEIARLVTERHLGATSTLYPNRALPQHEVLDTVGGADGEPRRVGSGSTSSPDPDAEPTPDPNEPPVEGAVRIADVKPLEGLTPAKNGKPARKWTKFLITDHHGVEHTTFDKTIADVAVKFRDEQTWVEISEITDGGYTNIEEIAPAGQQPNLPLDPGRL